ncbi:nucleoside kinase [Paenibacillus sp. LHD-117]|uniref:nucleoside kinase n=1 Tax=Paenibacillus sp. LHD-117 TaxID=3071412 RepID=UPI0027E052F6|nr:nucleoside kinase [Paenibacillus sp. LHD-117]MDQ6423512.1 nucleoside kinase [Paenibacillus sp. LHD-117]
MESNVGASMEGKLPLFIVTGSSGSGKTFVIPELRGIMPDFDIHDIDSLREVGVTDEQTIRNVWLRVAKNAAESGRMTIICGTAMTWDIEKCFDFAYFKHVYYLNLHCDDQTREQRLRARHWPEDMIEDYKKFAAWLVENADKAYSPPMPVVDTTAAHVADIAAQIKNWVLRYA